MTARRAVLLAFVVVATASIAERDARASDKRACIEAFDRGQSLRRDGKLRAARTELARCTADDCPRLVREDCAATMADVVASQPTVVLAARDASGGDLAAVHVLLDSAPLVDALDGRPVPVDPGEHVLRFVRDDGGAAMEAPFVALAGQKERLVAVTFPAPEAATPPPPGAPPAAALPPPPSAADRAPPATHARTPVAAYALGGVAVVAAGAALYLDLSATSNAHELRDTCAPGCDPSDVQGVRLRYDGAAVALGVAVAALAAAAVLVVTARGEAPPRAAFGYDRLGVRW